MTAIATDPRHVPAADLPARRRRRGTAASTVAHPARAGGAVLWAVIALAVVVAVGVVGSGSGQGAGVATAAGGSTPVAAGGATGGAAATVTLGEGETAWEALKPHTPDGVRHEVFVHEVVTANGVDARQLRPGDVLVVPGEGR